MIVRWGVASDCYRDSVALLAVSARLAASAGVSRASVAMATPANVAAAVDAGAAGPLDAGPSDVLVLVVADSEEAADAALADGLAALTATIDPAVGGSGSGGEEPATCIADALARSSGGHAPSVALISVPGPFAAAEARKALDAGLHVMIFSDNVAVEAEVALKALGRSRGLLVMGPDCGTAILDGTPLAFANVVRRGPVGLVGASGTGLQEVSTQLDRLGIGVSQLIGTGGRDLSPAVGGSSTLDALLLLGADPATQVVVLVSKPPDAAVARRVLEVAGSLGKPVVAVMLGTDVAAVAPAGVYGAATLAEAARLAARLAEAPAADRGGFVATGLGGPIAAIPGGPDAAGLAAALGGAAVTAATAAASAHGVGDDRPRRWLRGLFSGGTLGYEAQLVLRGLGVTVASNAPAPGSVRLGAGAGLEGHVVVDLGADEFTDGHPHPMIDPATRDRWVAEALEDPTVAVVLLDVVLGHGASGDPLAGLLPLLVARRSGPDVVVHVCGTDADPVPRRAVVDALRRAGALVAPSNAAAAELAAERLMAPERQP